MVLGVVLQRADDERQHRRAVRRHLLHNIFVVPEEQRALRHLREHEQQAATVTEVGSKSSETSRAAATASGTGCYAGAGPAATPTPNHHHTAPHTHLEVAAGEAARDLPEQRLRDLGKLLTLQAHTHSDRITVRARVIRP